jgi:hypothetical protein
VFKSIEEIIANGLTKTLGPQKWAKFIDLLEGKIRQDRTQGGSNWGALAGVFPTILYHPL